MAEHGPQETRLRGHLKGADHESVDDAADDWLAAAKDLATVSRVLRFLSKDEESLTGGTSDAFRAKLAERAELLHDRSELIRTAVPALRQSATRMQRASEAMTQLNLDHPAVDEPDPYTPPVGQPTPAEEKEKIKHQKAQKAYAETSEAREDVSRKWADKLDKEYDDQIQVMRLIRETLTGDTGDTGGPGTGGPNGPNGPSVPQIPHVPIPVDPYHPHIPIDLGPDAEYPGGRPRPEQGPPFDWDFPDDDHDHDYPRPVHADPVDPYPGPGPGPGPHTGLPNGLTAGLGLTGLGVSAVAARSIARVAPGAISALGASSRTSSSGTLGRGGLAGGVGTRAGGAGMGGRGGRGKKKDRRLPAAALEEAEEWVDEESGPGVLD